MTTSITTTTTTGLVDEKDPSKGTVDENTGYRIGSTTKVKGKGN